MMPYNQMIQLILDYNFYYEHFRYIYFSVIHNLYVLLMTDIIFIVCLKVVNILNS